MIELVRIQKSFGTVHALKGVTMKAGSGTIHGIVGENGAGKSTLMKILTGFISRTSGEILLEGKPLRSDTPKEARKAGIGMLYQEPLDFPQLSVLDNFQAGHDDFSPKQARIQLRGLCNDFDFNLLPDKLVEELTIGERQQLELLRIIREGVRVLILDEPTTGISGTQQELLFKALCQLREQGAAILLVSHKLEEIDQLCDEVTVLREGRIVASQHQPFNRDQIIQAMFGSLPERKTGRSILEKTGEPVLSFDKVEINSGRSGLHDASITINKGEVVGLAGVDGSGQSVFLKACFGLLPAEKGVISRFGSPLKNVAIGSEFGRTVFLPADRLTEGLLPSLTIREHHLLAHDRASFITGRSRLKETNEAIGVYNIRGHAHTAAADLSGGNQQRLLLSLIPSRAEIILLENPTRGLDIHSAAWTWNFLHKKAANQATVLFASPDLEEIMQEATRVVVFYNGRIILSEKTANTSFDIISRAITGDYVPSQVR